MENKNIRFITRAGLDVIARNVLNGYDTLLYCGNPKAVPIEEIIENHFGLKIEYVCLRKNGDILGTTVFSNTYVPVYCRKEGEYGLIKAKSGTVLIDESLLECANDGRLRFTLAHELSHWLLHRQIYKNAAAHTGEFQIEDNYSLEWQADYLASALLMPKTQVKNAFYELRNKTNDITSSLAKLFDVSKQAMTIFIKEHRLE